MGQSRGGEWVALPEGKARPETAQGAPGRWTGAWGAAKPRDTAGGGAVQSMRPQVVGPRLRDSLRGPGWVAGGGLGLRGHPGLRGRLGPERSPRA